MSRIFKRRYKPYTYAFLPSKDPDSLVIDLKKSLLGQMSGSIFTKIIRSLCLRVQLTLKDVLKHGTLMKSVLEMTALNNENLNVVPFLKY